jgi:hypothetical protein
MINLGEVTLMPGLIEATIFFYSSSACKLVAAGLGCAGPMAAL